MNLDTILNDLESISNPNNIHAMEQRYLNMKVLRIPFRNPETYGKKDWYQS
jgi:hypothetical protein